ncbi:MAG: bifunctional adenosylcobinamide kinase/adenosylcobinamide-phosphate guanylyltransferase [Deltaproteobacteria bacterium]|nr:bifunctional adenosylcobinamide kinase/adenosylcobinamide-phosphate guanylyltransferase [Deltaproteobacteria bacterium]
MSEFIFITGGRRSGKSSYALELAESLGTKCLYIATAEAYDEEMEARIVRHKEERGDSWETAEEPYHVADLLRDSSKYDVILVDCLTLWLCNVMHEELIPSTLMGEGQGGGEKMSDEEYILEKIDDLTLSCRESHAIVIVVTNELGLGVIPDNTLSRQFTDLAGIMNQRMAAAADRVVLTVSGIPMIIKGA